MCDCMKWFQRGALVLLFLGVCAAFIYAVMGTPAYAGTTYIAPGQKVTCTSGSACHGACVVDGSCAVFGISQNFSVFINLTSFTQSCNFNGYINGIKQCRSYKLSWMTKIGNSKLCPCT
ncbi:MAG: hypothetical protein QNK37_21665 [Acidobacteriota bacterium]|nr:hypothetical protein [Acidobacteriota bacterium]